MVLDHVADRWETAVDEAAAIIELVTTYLSSVTSTPNEVEPI